MRRQIQISLPADKNINGAEREIKLLVFHFAEGAENLDKII